MDKMTNKQLKSDIKKILRKDVPKAGLKGFDVLKKIKFKQQLSFLEKSILKKRGIIDTTIEKGFIKLRVTPKGKQILRLI